MKFSACVVAIALTLAAQTAAAQEAPRGVPVTVEELVAEALRVHPEIQAASRMVDARRARIPQARALPDPEFSIGYMGDPAPFKVQRGDPSSYRQLGVMQEIPYPGKLALRGQIAAKDADAEQWSIEAARRRIAAEVRVAYFELWAVRQGVGVTTRSKDLLEKLARITEERYKVGQGLQQDVLRAQTEVSRVIQRLALLTQRERTLTAQLNSLLQRPHDTPVGPLADVRKAPLAYSLDELVARAADDSPDVRMTQERIEQNQLAMRLAQRDYYPDFRIGWDYQNRPGMPEMYGLRFSVNIPIFYRSKQREAVNEAASSLAGAQHQREAVRTVVSFQVKEQFLAARTSEELITLYSRGLLPQTALTLESSLAAYQTGAVDFLTVLSSFLANLDYETEYYNELAAYQKALTRLQALTGLELVK